MDTEADQPTTIYKLTPDLIKAIIPEADDKGSASRALRATCWHLRTVLPATFAAPLQVTLCRAQRSFDFHTLLHPCSSRAAITGSNAQDQVDTHCSWPLLQLWQQQQQRLGRSTMQLTSMHLQMASDPAWRHAGNSSSSGVSGSAPKLIPSRCLLLQQDALLQQLTSLTVTCSHGTCGDVQGVPSSTHNTCSSTAVDPAVAAESSSRMMPAAATFLNTLLSSATSLSTFALHLNGADASGPAPVWLQLSSGSNNTPCNITDRPCFDVLPAVGLREGDVMAIGVLGRSLLPQLLQLQYLQHLVLPIVLLPDQQQQYRALHPDLTATVAAVKTDDTTMRRSREGGSCLEVLELLLIPAVSALSALEQCAAASWDICTAATLQRLLLPLAMLQQLQQLHITVLSSSAVHPAAEVVKLASLLKNVFPRLREFSLAVLGCTSPPSSPPKPLHFNRATWDYASSSISSLVSSGNSSNDSSNRQSAHEPPQLRSPIIRVKPAIDCHREFGAVPLVYPVSSTLQQAVLKELQDTDTISEEPAAGADAAMSAFAAAAAAAAGTPLPLHPTSWTGLNNEQHSALLKLRRLSLSCSCWQSHLLPALPSSCLEHITWLQLAIPQTVLPQLSWLLPDQASTAGAAALKATTGSSSSSSQLWGRLRRLDLALDYGGEQDNREAGDDVPLWQLATHQQQRHAVQLLLGACSHLTALKLQGSTRAGVSLVPDLQALAEAASDTLQELQILHTLPFVAKSDVHMGSIPYLTGFSTLQKLHLARRAVDNSAPLVLQLLPASLQELRLQGFCIGYTFAADAAAALNNLDLQSQAGVQGASGKRRMAAKLLGLQEGLQQCSLQTQQSCPERNRSCSVMPHLRLLSLVDCYYDWTPLPQDNGEKLPHCLSIQHLVAWAGAKLRCLTLVRFISCSIGYKSGLAAVGNGPSLCSSLSAPALPELRSFTCVNSRIGVTGDSSTAPNSDWVTDVLGYLQANASELQHLELIQCQYYADDILHDGTVSGMQPVVDKHVPLLLSMGLRSLRLCVGPLSGHVHSAMGMSVTAAEELCRHGACGAVDAVKLLRTENEVLPVMSWQRSQPGADSAWSLPISDWLTAQLKFIGHQSGFTA